MAGYVWLVSFLERNPEVSLRKAERLSLVRAYGMNSQEIHNFFKILETALKENKS
jgi:hypothetical protein